MYSGRYESGQEDRNTRVMWDTLRAAGGVSGPPPPPPTQGLRVEISDDDDEDLSVPSIFQNSSTATDTPPLDLSMLTPDGTGRQVESPLDLSVKTRKRCADSTEHYGDLRLVPGHAAGGPAASKRLCLMPQSGEPSGLSGTVGDVRFVTQQRMLTESVIKSKCVAGKSPLSAKSPQRTRQQPSIRNVSASQSPLAQRHVATNQSIVGPQTSLANQPFLFKQGREPVSSGLLTKVIDPVTGQMCHIPNPALNASQSQIPVARPESYTSESTNLKGFFEPTAQKHILVRNYTAYPSPKAGAGPRISSSAEGFRDGRLPGQADEGCSVAASVNGGLVHANSFLGTVSRGFPTGRVDGPGQPTSRHQHRVSGSVPFPGYHEGQSIARERPRVSSIPGQMASLKQGPYGVEQRMMMKGTAEQSAANHRDFQQNPATMLLSPTSSTRMSLYGPGGSDKTPINAQDVIRPGVDRGAPRYSSAGREVQPQGQSYSTSSSSYMDMRKTSTHPTVPKDSRHLAVVEGGTVNESGRRDSMPSYQSAQSAAMRTGTTRPTIHQHPSDSVPVTIENLFNNKILRQNMEPSRAGRGSYMKSSSSTSPSGRGSQLATTIYRTNARELGIDLGQYRASAADSVAAPIFIDHRVGRVDLPRSVVSQDGPGRLSEAQRFSLDKQALIQSQLQYPQRPPTHSARRSMSSENLRISQDRQSNLPPDVPRFPHDSVGVGDSLGPALSAARLSSADCESSADKRKNGPGRRRSLVEQHLLGAVTMADDHVQQAASGRKMSLYRTIRQTSTADLLQNNQRKYMSGNQQVSPNIPKGSQVQPQQKVSVVMHTNSSNISRQSPQVAKHSVDAKNLASMNGNTSDTRASPRPLLLSGLQKTCADESSRSIVKGTSGVHKDKREPEDFFSALVLKELQSGTDEAENPFSNRSILQEFDRSARPTQDIKRQQDKASEKSAAKDQDQMGKDAASPRSGMSSDSTYKLPLKLAIPGSGPGTAAPSTTSPFTVPAVKTEKARNPKVWSRKHMILSAVKQDEDLKNIVDLEEKKPAHVDPSKSSQRRKDGEKHGVQDVPLNCPASPKMPILSPQEKLVAPSGISLATGEPPMLDAPSSSDGPQSAPDNGSSTETTHSKGMHSLERHLHKLISDAVKGQGSFANDQDTESVCESVYRELRSQPPPHKPFLSRQLSQSKNIPVANVAPIVHGRHFKSFKPGEARLEEEMTELQNEGLKHDDNDNEINEKIAECLEKETENMPSHPFEMKDSSRELYMEHPSSNATHVLEYMSSNVNFNKDGLFEDENVCRRMSPVMKKAILQRHMSKTDCNENCDDVDNNSSGFAHSPSQIVNTNETTNKGSDVSRNVFGAFKEFAFKDNSNSMDTEVETIDSSREDTPLDFGNGYEGDDEGRKDRQEVKKNRQTSARQKADKLVKQARHCKLEEQKCPKSSIDISVKRECHSSSELDSARTGTRRCRRKSRSSKGGRCSSGDVHSDGAGADRPKAASPSDEETEEEPHVEAVQAEVGESTNEKWTIKDTSASLKQTLRSGKSKGGLTMKISLKESDEDGETTEYEDIESLTEQFKIQDSPKEPKRPIPAAKKKRGFHFKQKYIFQRKKRGRGKARAPERQERAIVPTQSLLDPVPDHCHYDAAITDCAGAVGPGGVEYDEDQIPVPAEVRRLAVNKDRGETLLHRAARMGYEEVALYCLATGSVDVNARDNAGYTPLHECAVRNHLTIAKHLVTHGADVNCCSLDGIRPIHDAVENDRLETVRLLLAYGADPLLSTYSGRTPLKLARTERMRKFLLSYYGDVNGYGSEVEESPWQFAGSTTATDAEVGRGCLLFADMPSDPEDETGETCSLSAKPQFPTHRITDDTGKRVEDYILLDDILRGYGVDRAELDDLDLSPLLVKAIRAETFQKGQKNSVFQARALLYPHRHSNGGQPYHAVRCVDAAQVVNTVSKYAAGKALKRSRS